MPRVHGLAAMSPHTRLQSDDPWHVTLQAAGQMKLQCESPMQVMVALPVTVVLQVLSPSQVSVVPS